MDVWLRHVHFLSTNGTWGAMEETAFTNSVAFKTRTSGDIMYYAMLSRFVCKCFDPFTPVFKNDIRRQPCWLLTAIREATWLAQPLNP